MAKRRSRPSRTRRLAKWAAAAIAGVLGATALAVVPWRWVNPPTSAFILRDRTRTGVPRTWVEIQRIAPALQIAVIASEDQKFPAHRGFDVDQIARAIQEDRRRPRGASTISQQVAKNLYLWPGRSFVRKGLEAWLTAWIELCWPKRRILEIYLNVAEFGPGVFGARSASRHFFGKEPRALTPEEAALMAAVLPDPKRMSVANPSEYVRERATEIDGTAEKLGRARYLRRL